jgi:hypothetical protein
MSEPLLRLPNISKSLLGSLTDFYDHNVLACGKEILYKHFYGVQGEPSKAMRLGTYFEYLATGYVHPKDLPPQPEYTYGGKKLETNYERAKESVELYKKMITAHKVQIVKVGEYMKYDGSSGISDIRAKVDGVDSIIDTKYSGMIDDKWSEFGWDTETLVNKHKTLMQPIHYKYLMKKIYGIPNIPFYFWIFSAQNSDKAKIIRLDVSDENLEMHEHTFLPKMKKYINYFFENPAELTPRPNYNRCKACSFFNVCEYRVTVPQVEVVSI